MKPSLVAWATKAKEAPSPREVRLACWTPTQYVLGEFQHKGGRRGGVVQNLMQGSLSQYIGGAWEGLKMLSKNTCEGVHLIVKLPAISLQFTKDELLHTYF